MRESVRSAFVNFTLPFEGCVNFMYLDKKMLCTTGLGFLIDPIDAAFALPFVEADGRPATRASIAAAFHTVKARAELAERGGGAFRGLTSVHLTNEGIKQVVMTKLAQMDSFLRGRFPALEEWPADAQLALFSQSWAAGPAFRAPRFDIAARALDFDGCARECKLNTARDPVNALLYRNAAQVLSGNLDPDVLYYPSEILGGEHVVPDDDRPIFILPDIDPKRPPDIA